MNNQEVAEASLLKINHAFHSLLSQGLKITQARVAEISGLSIRTVQRHWDEFEVPEIEGDVDMSAEEEAPTVEAVSVDSDEIPVHARPFKIHSANKELFPNPYTHPKVYLKMYKDLPKVFYLSKDPVIQQEMKEIQEQNLYDGYGIY